VRSLFIILRGADATLLGEPALRIFQQGAEAVYACEVYDGAAGKGGLTTTATILRDGRIIHQELPASLGSKAGASAVQIVPVVGRVPLQNLSPGFYTLQITAARILNGKVTPQATQWATFEVR
jgi:hypothetical protein